MYRSFFSPFSAYIIYLSFRVYQLTKPYTEPLYLLLALKMFPYNSENHFFLDTLGWPKNMQRANGGIPTR